MLGFAPFSLTRSGVVLDAGVRPLRLRAAAERWCAPLPACLRDAFDDPPPDGDVVVRLRG